MSRNKRIFLTSINACLILVGILFGTGALLPPVPPDKLTPEQIQTFVDQTTNLEKLKKMIMVREKRSGLYHRLASLFHDAVIVGSGVAVIVGTLTIFFINFRTGKTQINVQAPSTTGERSTSSEPQCDLNPTPSTKWRADFPHPVVLQQASLSQPHLAFWLLLVFGPSWGPTVINKALLYWPFFANLTKGNPNEFQAVFFLFQLSLVGSAFLFLSVRYAPALWNSRPPLKQYWFRLLVIALPMLLYHICHDCVWSPQIDFFNLCIRLGDTADVRDALRVNYDGIWGDIAGGTSPIAVICCSLRSVVFPILEEVLFTGILLNITARRFGIAIAACTVPVCFSLAHVFAVGIGWHLIGLFLLGLTCVAARLATGNLTSAILCHLAVNFVIFVPGWCVALAHFKYP